MKFNLDQEIEKFQKIQIKKLIQDIKNGKIFQNSDFTTFSYDKIQINLSLVKSKYILSLELQNLVQLFNTNTKLFWERSKDIISCPIPAAKNNNKISKEYKNFVNKQEVINVLIKKTPDQQIQRLLKNKQFIYELISSILTNGYFIISHHYIEQYDIILPHNYLFINNICKKLNCDFEEIEEDPNYSDIQYKLFFKNNDIKFHSISNRF